MKGFNEQIWLTSALTDSEVTSALTLCFSLKRAATSRKTGVIVSSAVSLKLRESIEKVFDYFIFLQEDRNTVGLKTNDFVKLFALTLTNFSECVMLSPNMLVLQNCDELFDWAEESELHFGLRKQHDMSVIGIRPSLREFNSLLKQWDSSSSNNIDLSPTNQNLDDKYNRSLLVDSDMIFGNRKEISIVTLPENFSGELETQSKGLLVEIVVAYWNRIQTENVRPLLELLRNPNISTPQSSTYKNDGVAIVGMSCRYPCANNLEEFWNILLEGLDATGSPPDFRWRNEQSAPSSKPGCRKINAGFLKCPVDEFDAKFFGLSPKELASLDPQHRLLHELVWEGLEDAAINPQLLEGTNGGVFVGSWTSDYKEMLVESGSTDFFRRYMGNSIGAGAARISHMLGLTGPSIATESGCSAAMVAVHLACKSLGRRETNLALACGVNLLLFPFDRDVLPMAMSPEGRCKTFDAKADGFARAEGAGVLVLKRVSDAIRDEDKIWAVIKGSGITQEGVSKSMGTPTIHSESLAMTTALKDSNVNPANVSYIEAHGTGTVVGDPMEIGAIAKAYHSKERKEPLLIGSVKTNVGHTESCSGITGIMKVVLSMKHEIIPRHRNFETLNPAIDLDAIPAKIPLESTSWPRVNGRQRLAGVSSFGITGTDAHVIIEESPAHLPPAIASSGFERPAHIIKLSAKTEEALELILENMRAHLGTTTDDLHDLAYTANIGRADFSQRAIIIGKSKEEAVKSIDEKNIIRGEEAKETIGKVCFLFTGQGSQYSGMGKQLYETSPVFRIHFEYCAKIFKNRYNIDITQVLWSEANSMEISRTLYCQTSIFCVEYALLKLWESWGVKADYALGHSLGEFAAAVCAGILTVEDAIMLVAERSRLIDNLPRGKMLVIKADKERVRRLMKEFISNENEQLDIAAINSAEQTVVAGDSEMVLQFGQFCKENGLKCIVLEATHAFHSRHMDPMLDEYRTVANTVKKLDGNDCKYISGIRGTLVEAEKVSAEYWVEHTREKVLFLDASKKAVALGCKNFIEIGPQPVLSVLTMMNNDTQLTCLPSLKRNENEWETLLNTLGKLYVKGFEIDWKGFEELHTRRKVSLPHYPFIGKTYWAERLISSGVSIHPLLGSVIPNASSTRLFTSGLNLNSLEYVKDHAIGENIVFPGAGYLEMVLAAGLATVEGSTSALPTPNRAMKVENLSIEAPLPLNESKACQVQTVVELNENQGDWNDMKVSIFRRMDSEFGQKWLSHAKATFSPLLSAEEKNIDFDISLFNSTLAREPDEVSEILEAYDKLSSLGLKFGPTFKSIEKIWRNDEPGMLLAKVNVASLREGRDPLQNQYIIHPVVIDAMIQAFMMLRECKKIKKLSVPIKIGKFIWLKGIDYSAELYIQAHQSGDEKTGSSGSALLVSSAGEVLAVMESVEMIETTVKAVAAVLDQQTSSMPEVYEELWKPKKGAHQFSTDMKKASGKFYSAEFLRNYTEMNETLPKELANTFREMEHFVYLNILRGMHELGWQPEEGQIFKEESLFSELGIIEGYRLYFGFILEVFEQEGVLQKVSSSSSEITWKIVKKPTHLETVIQELSTSVSSVSTKFKGSLLFLKLGETLKGILKGEISGLSILFPDGQAEYPPVSQFYTEYGQVFRMIEMFSGISASWMRHAKAQFGDERVILRILELGAGTGSFSEGFLKVLVEEGFEFEYTYTDISAAFFPAAEKRFEKYAKSIKFKKLNIEEDPLDQGFSPEYFDWVCASDVIHATKDIRQSLQNIRMLMKPFAKIDIQEMTKVLRVVTFSFGLLDGFWRFKDHELRARHCTLSKQSWEKILEQTGFRSSGTFSTLWDNHSYICAERTEAPFSNYCDKLVDSSPNSKTWLVFHQDTHPISEFIQNKMRKSTLRKTICITGGDNFEEAEGNEPHFKIRKGNENDYMKLLEAVLKKKLNIEGIIYCWALDKSQANQEELLQPYFYLTKAVLTSKLSFLPRLYAVTTGTVALEDNELSHFHSSTLLGFTRSLKNEIFGMHTKCIEVADGKWDKARMEEIFYEIWNLDKDILVAFQGNSRLIPKLHPHKVLNHALSLPKGTDRFQLVLPESKSISDLEFGVLDTFNLKEDEVEVQIKASALNFRDVLSVIKPTEQFKDINAVGFDFGGVVKRIGSKVTKWQVGDLVYGCNMDNGALPSHLCLSEELLNPLPPNMTVAEAATIPAVYMTSILCLLEVAKIKKEDVVLLHTASGGVGLSAIEICKYIGCIIIATAGSKRKQNYLRSVGIQNVFHSRNTQFGDQILELTNGKGVDVVLNSLTSEGFKEATLKACAKEARFIEMSKLNIWKAEEVKKLRPDVEYSIVDVSSLDLDEFKHLSKRIDSLRELNVVKPIPYVRYDALNIREALSYMQKAKHIGKIVCVMPEQRQIEGRVQVWTPMFNERSSYLITGGLGGIGFEVCKWMIEKGAKHVVLAGRSLPKAPIQREINELNSSGANVIPIQLDVGHFEACKDFIQVKMVEMGLPQLKGVMHSAGTLADSLIANQTWINLSSTFNTKVNGSMNLHELTKDKNLEHFVMFSSMAALFGTPGQCNHSAGNLFEDTLAHYRHSIGLPATTINWGPWGEVGIATEVDLPGTRPLSNLQGITGLEYAMGTHRTQSAILGVSSFAILSKMFPQLAVYLDERIWKSSASGSASSTIKSDEFWQQYDSASETEEKVAVLKTQLRNILRRTLKLDENDEIGDEVELAEMGVDSLMFVEIRNGLQTLLGDRLAVNTSALKDCNTVSQIATTFVSHIEGLSNNVENNEKLTMEQVNALIRQDCQLPEHIRAKPEQVVGILGEVSTVLLTGCSGTLGPHVLKELTALSQITQVICLMRPRKNEGAEERLQKILDKNGLLNGVNLNKVKLISGDVSLPRLGMNSETWNNLSKSVDAIFNCSAAVSHTELYRKTESRAGARAVNIGGMKNLLEFACDGKLKFLCHASSLLAVITINKEDKLSEDWPTISDYDNVTRLAYPVSKFVGDYLAKEAVECGIPVKIIRFPLITGDERVGCVNPETNHALMRFIFILKSGAIPSTPFPLNALPVDSCAAAFVHLFFDERDTAGVYNVSHAHPAVDQAFVDVAKRFDRHVVIVELSEFLSRVKEDQGENKALENFKDFYGDEDALVSTMFAAAAIFGVEDINSLFKSKKVAAVIPNFYENQLPPMEYIYRDLSLLKEKGWFEKFGL